MSLKDNWLSLQKKIKAECEKNFISIDDITIIAVSKNHSVDKIRELYELGHRDFGENYVQEWEDKAKLLKDLTDIRWHFIGGLQSNKVNKVVGKVELIHTVDRYKLAKAISKKAVQDNVVQKILVQIDYTNREDRSGLKDFDIAKFFRETLSLENLKIEGLMVIAPNVDEGNEIRKCFENLRELLRANKDVIPLEKGSFSHLSMGMSSDYSIAIEEGSTMIRIGTAIFGNRD